eukprot:TRINITY_DN6716_c0_g1_i1.p1 TRINITY_DN6716_c0_g1~~TRINITY_DN6716_c0_g1_i1.p1  ORF type:complete len:288 (-),score=96.05 TRINITY_DN6716_c0_g1_i1:180-971(-)
MNAAKRIQKEYEKMVKEAVPGIEAAPNSQDLFKWKASIAGPTGSPYEGGMFELDIKLPQKYPLEPPRVAFKTKIFHPNVSGSGEICLDLLQSQWSPALSLQKVMLSISSLLTDPNFADPLNGTAAALHKKSKKEYDLKCRDMTQQFATSKAATEALAAQRKRKFEEVAVATAANPPLSGRPPSSPTPATAPPAAAQAVAQAAVAEPVPAATRPPVVAASGATAKPVAASPPQAKAKAKAKTAAAKGKAEAKGKAKAKAKTKVK